MLSNYLKDLFYENDFVIVPGFGAFVSRTYPSTIDEKEGRILPPRKKIGFNESMRSEDVLLAHYISKKERITYFSAKEFIRKEVSLWQERLKNGETVELSGIGSFTRGNENKLIFSGRKTQNFLSSSFGLTDYTLKPVVRERVAPVVRKKIKIKRKPKVLLGSLYAAASIILLAFSLFVSLHYQPLKNSLKSSLFLIDTVETVVEQDTKIDDTILMVPETTEEAEIEDFEEFHIISGSFASFGNAEKMAMELKDRGFSTKILNTEKAFFRVSVNNFADSSMAVDYLNKIRKGEFPSAWILKQTNDQ